MEKVSQKDESEEPTWNLTRNFKEEGITTFFVLSLILATAFVACVLFVARIGAIAYIGVVGVMSGAMWMPYLMALIYYNTVPALPCPHP